jgi:hypothetical protein
MPILCVCVLFLAYILHFLFSFVLISLQLLTELDGVETLNGVFVFAATRLVLLSGGCIFHESYIGKWPYWYVCI